MNAPTRSTSPFPPARNINLVVVHCADTPNERTLFEGAPGAANFRTPAQVIDRWHAERGFARAPSWRARQEPGLAAIGYHWVIARNGAVFNGRHIDEVGAHAQGWNASSLGICLVGRDQFTAEQYRALEGLLKSLYHSHDIPLAPPRLGVDQRKGVVHAPGVIGHGKLPGHARACPGFDVERWLRAITA